MIRLWSSIITLCLILVACLASAWWIDNVALAYIDLLHQAQGLVEEEENWEDASQITKTVFQDWESKAFPLYTLLRHDDLDDILLSFQSVSQYLDQQDKEPYTANNAQLIAHLQLLAEMEQCTWKNIL